jgi:hypothetical protein
MAASILNLRHFAHGVIELLPAVGAPFAIFKFFALCLKMPVVESGLLRSLTQIDELARREVVSVSVNDPACWFVWNTLASKRKARLHDGRACSRCLSRLAKYQPTQAESGSLLTQIHPLAIARSVALAIDRLRYFFAGLRLAAPFFLAGHRAERLFSPAAFAAATDSLACCTTFSTVKWKCSNTAFAGPEAPKVFWPTMRPSSPT